MLRSLNYLLDFKIRATDGDLGSIHDFYFDDELWMIRFFVVDTGNWLPGRKVLISPVAAGEAEVNDRVIPVDLSKEQVKNSPDVSTERPVSKQSVEGLYSYYGWAFPWEGVVYMPPSLAPDLEAAQAAVEAEQAAAEAEPQQPQGDPHLRSFKDVTGYAVSSADGPIGHVQDMVMDDEDVRIRYLVVDTKPLILGKLVVISPEWVREVSYADETVYAHVSHEDIKSSPAYAPLEPLDREREAKIFAHFRRPPYWIE
jgi:hypothetical protein